MSQPFDPYEKWFEIPQEERPVNHYLLLGLKPYESNLKVIRAAGEKRVEFLQDVSGGRHVEAAQKCLNEVAKAVLCLTNPAKKLAYDRQLKNASQVLATPAVDSPGSNVGSPVLVKAPENSAGGTSQAVSVRTRTVSKSATTGSKQGAGSKNVLLIKIAASAVLVFTIGYLLSVLLSSDKKDEATTQAKKTGAEKKFDEEWEFPDSNKEPKKETKKEPKKETAGSTEITQLDIPTSTSDEPDNPHQKRLSDSKGRKVKFKASVVSVATSTGKNIIYLHFSKNKKQGLTVFTARRNVGEDWTRESVEELFKGKKVKVSGVVKYLPGPGQLLGVKVTAKEQIELVDQ